ncbi:MAG: 3-dehydroquinate synthase [Oscillospiraceae bacterium]|nr:3-dehydroquinate synthase [Oscillospiraceae bacterium]
MKTLTIDLPGRAYDILIERGLLQQAGRLVREAVRGERIAVVTDYHVEALYGSILKDALEGAGFLVSITAILPGEESKTVSTLEKLYDAFMDFGLTRSDAVLALGGGVVGDLAGFAAATILRGVDFVQVPTTLLAQVDSSVGGKVAVDLKAGKNLAGAFYQPRLVLIDPGCLQTLSGRIFADGMAEVIKYGAILDKALLERLSAQEPASLLRDGLEQVIYRCCDLKRQVVEEDERDNRRRMLLNFGHTLGHAYEAAYQYRSYIHGEAVAAGMCKMADLQQKHGLLAKEESLSLRSLIARYGLPTRIPCSMEAYEAAIGLDKKGRGQEISLVLLRRLGEAYLQEMPRRQLFDWLREEE